LSDVRGEIRNNESQVASRSQNANGLLKESPRLVAIEMLEHMRGVYDVCPPVLDGQPLGGIATPDSVGSAKLDVRQLLGCHQSKRRRDFDQVWMTSERNTEGAIDIDPSRRRRRAASDVQSDEGRMPYLVTR
jgi:hypothetical protein